MTETNEVKLIPKALRRVRERLEMSQTELARRVGTMPQQISNWETGHRKISLKNLLRIVYGVGSDLEEFGGILKEVGGREAKRRIPHRVTIDVDDLGRRIDESVQRSIADFYAVGERKTDKEGTDENCDDGREVTPDTS